MGTLTYGNAQRFEFDTFRFVGSRPPTINVARLAAFSRTRHGR